MRTPEAGASPVGHWIPAHVDHYGLGARSQVPVDRKWALGLQSHAHPREIMNEVLKALQELNVCWKKIGHYNMKCRWVPGLADGQNTMVNNQLHFRDESSIIEDDCAMTSPTVIKFELQVTINSHIHLYQQHSLEKINNCLVRFVRDMNRSTGFTFVELCWSKD
jgi:5'-AMP-activated protein kinase catalytic alpha subunit